MAVPAAASRTVVRFTAGLDGILIQELGEVHRRRNQQRHDLGGVDWRWSLNAHVFSGAIVDSGTIFATSRGILIDSGGVISGGIQVSSKGRISAGGSGIIVENATKFAGGISNSGRLSAGGANSSLLSAGPGAGVDVASGGSFSGGIVNALGGDHQRANRHRGLRHFHFFRGDHQQRSDCIKPPAGSGSGLGRSLHL